MRRPERRRPGRRPGRGRRATGRGAQRRRRGARRAAVRGADARHPARRCSTGPTTGWPTPPCGSSTTCSTTRPNQPVFGLAFRREWESFRAYNAAFADALAEGAGPAGRGHRAMVQDYHLTLVAPDARASAAPTWRSRTSRTPRGRRRTTSRCCPTTWRARCSTASSAPTMPGSTRERWADAFLDCCEAVLGAAGGPGRADRPARRPHHHGRRPPAGRGRGASFAPGPRPTTCRRTWPRSPRSRVAGS